MRRWALWLALVATQAAAAETDPALKDQFSRAVRLFDTESYPQALAEFEALYAKTRASGVRFNIAVTQAQLGRALDAVATLEALLSAPAQLSAERLAFAQKLAGEQRARIATLTLGPAPAGLEQLVVELDGMSRLVKNGEELKLDPGRHDVTVLAQGHLPWRESVLFAPGETKALNPQLVRSELKPAKVRIVCPLSDVEVRIDGRDVGRTPVATAIGVSPGSHEISLRREGYKPLVAAVQLAEDASETLKFEPQPDPDFTAHGALKLTVSEEQAVVAIDGKTVATAGTVALTPGRHQVQVVREGFLPLERDALIPREGSVTLRAQLEPTADYLAALADRRDLHRFWGFTGVAVGAGAAAIGLTVFGVNRPAYDRANASYDALFARRNEPGVAEQLKIQAAILTDKEWIQVAGLVTLGAGLVVAVAGTLSLATAPDVSRYQTPPGTDSLAPLGALQLQLGPGSVALRGTF